MIPNKAKKCKKAMQNKWAKHRNKGIHNVKGRKNEEELRVEKIGKTYVNKR